MDSAPSLVLPNPVLENPGGTQTRVRRQDLRAPVLSSAGAALVVALVAAGYYAPTSGGPVVKPLLEIGKLVAAAAIGLLVTSVYRSLPGEKPPTAAMQQAQVLLCVSGAVMMLIIGDSLARAFGILGAASIIWFRTPVKDPRSVTILFLLMGLGMALGLGAYSLAGLGAGFLCVFLTVLPKLHVADPPPRSILLRVTSTGPDFPDTHVAHVLVRRGAAFEPREVQGGDQVVSLYQVAVPAAASLNDLTRDLMDEGHAGIRAVAWESPKKGG